MRIRPHGDRRRALGCDGRRSWVALSSSLLIVGDIARALRRCGDPALVDQAIAGLSDERYTRRLAAARALGAIADRRAVDALRAALHDAVACASRR
jgi:HEAT repeat protein